MSTFISEPGTRLGGRYRLEDRIAAAGGWAAWKAIDEILARAVTVFTFAPGFPRIREVVTAARAASRLTDARLTQVFDVEDDWDRAYIVLEWAVGEPLDDMLAAGATADDPALADTLGLARLLYAALTAHWPGPASALLPAAPVADGLPCTPRQVLAGVPTALDDITCRALFQQERRSGTALTTPGQLAGALSAAIPPAAPPPQAPPPRAPSRAIDFSDTGPISGGDGEYWPHEGDAAGLRDRPRRSAPGGRRPTSMARAGVVAVVVLAVAAAVTAAALVLRPSQQAASGGTHSPTTGPSAAAAAILAPQRARGFD